MKRFTSNPYHEDWEFTFWFILWTILVTGVVVAVVGLFFGVKS